MSAKNIGITLGSFILGLLIMGGVIYKAAPGLMIHEDVSKYSFEQSVDVFTQTVKSKGWKIPKVYDLQETMKKFGKDVSRVKVFELCHPGHAYQILSKDKERVVASLMPCRVAIYEKSNGKVYVSRMNTALMGGMMDGVIPEVMGHASADSEKFIKSIVMN